MADSVHGANGISAIQHTGQEHKSRAAVAREVGELRPDERTTSISSARLRRHNSTDQNRNDQESNAKHTARISHSGKEPLPEHDKQIVNPGNPQESEEDVPTLRSIFGMVH